MFREPHPERNGEARPHRPVITNPKAYLQEKLRWKRTQAAETFLPFQFSVYLLLKSPHSPDVLAFLLQTEPADPAPFGGSRHPQPAELSPF